VIDEFSLTAMLMGFSSDESTDFDMVEVVFFGFRLKLSLEWFFRYLQDR
jgi:hypothetical protein